MENNQKSLKEFIKPAIEIKEIKAEWKEKMRKREQEGYTEKELVNAHFESVKYKDLEWIKQQGGPFTKPEGVDQYMNSSHGEEIINKRLYVEVRYARNSCLSMKPTASVFSLNSF